jgi:hypothetical protein
MDGLDPWNALRRTREKTVDRFERQPHHAAP